MTKAILLAFGVSAALSGCMPSVLQYDRGNPVVMSSLQQGATRESVLSAAGRPLDAMVLPGINGVCYNYLLRNRGNSSPYYVAFNAQGRVVNAGYIACEKAVAAGYLDASEPIKPRY
ncbi:hypothetical protein CEE60_10260 [Stenotrophomonas maltophilia]|uniref:Uncharacterized protein n=1 Tax=Stenotrophomonas maltophilia TaxID=40324 RepID=A0A246HMV9_STEMA|nr:outer membrane protein assembly factor BamE [Stenotrophomonas maltophilia]OWQ54029.1 hypothetical protein CEE60_10260 [Stenotrophomonas maltophilia]HAV72384.1 outer membrane protein assembly factor BamE [Stenotrophomonas sp.]